mmetsp:Transcript_21555/g.53185  ORF Transcript_21555/g.53185 Transcript_21555/m.53185 type:complete len:176 (-) Transcript_21555:379-906(-)
MCACADLQSKSSRNKMGKYASYVEPDRIDPTVALNFAGYVLGLVSMLASPYILAPLVDLSGNLPPSLDESFCYSAGGGAICTLQQHAIAWISFCCGVGAFVNFLVVAKGSRAVQHELCIVNALLCLGGTVFFVWYALAWQTGIYIVLASMAMLNGAAGFKIPFRDLMSDLLPEHI